MKYFDEMQDKYGFQDGGAIPPDAWECRQVYVAVVNKLAERKGSAVRAVEYDRGGMHNSCMILFASTDQAQRFAAKEIGDFNEVRLDTVMHEAIDDANELDLDEYIIVEVRIDDGFAGFLAGL